MKLTGEAELLRISEDLPIVIEIVDAPDRIAAFLPGLDTLMDEGLITLEKVRVIACKPGPEKKG